MIGSLSDIGKWLLDDLRQFLPVVGLVASTFVFGFVSFKSWSKARGHFDRYDAAVDKYIIDGPQSASSDLEALDLLSPERRATIKRDLMAIKAMLRDMQDLSTGSLENLQARFDSNPEQFEEFRETLEAMDAAATEALNTNPDTWDLKKHKRALRRYWRMSQSPYDRAMKSLAQKTVTNATLAGPTTYAEE